MAAESPQQLKAQWDELWDNVCKHRSALEAGIRGGVSVERRRALEHDFEHARRVWWKAVTEHQ